MREVASGLAFLHKHGVCVGDISPKNLLFSLTPHEAVYFIDCDAMRIDGVSALTQGRPRVGRCLQVRIWRRSISDTYKLGLLGLRLLAGDHAPPIPRTCPRPGLLRQIITETLTKQPQSRPLPEAWSYVLGQAIEEAQYRTKTAAPANAPLAAPEIPIVHSRPSGGSAPPVRPSAPPPPPSVPPAWAPPASAPTSSKGAIWGAAAAIAAVIAVVGAGIAVVLGHHNTGTTSSAPSSSTTPSSSDSDRSSTPTTTTPIDPEADALQQLQQLAAGDRHLVASQLADRWIPQLQLQACDRTMDLRQRRRYGVSQPTDVAGTSAAAPAVWRQTPLVRRLDNIRPSRLLGHHCAGNVQRAQRCAELVHQQRPDPDSLHRPNGQHDAWSKWNPRTLMGHLDDK